MDGDNGQPFDNPNFLDFVERFGERGQIASVCEADYAKYFDDFADLVDTACDDFPE